MGSKAKGEQHQDSMKCFPTEGQEWVVLQNNLIRALQLRFEWQGWMQDLDERGDGKDLDERDDGKDLDEAIQHHRTALQLRPEGHPLHSHSLNNLATVQGVEKDIDEAIQHLRTALQLRPDSHPDHSVSLNNLAIALSTQFEQQGDGKYLDEAIQHHRTALQLRPEGHPDHSHSLNNLGTVLSTQFEQQGDGKDLDEAIQHHRTALELMPESHLYCSVSLNNLATALSTQFEQRGDGKDLDEAIQHHRTALQLRPEGHPNHSTSLNNLATALSTRFDQQVDRKDLNEAIQHHRTALQLRPEDHPLHSTSLNNLAAALSTQFDQQGNGKDLDEAIQHHRTALQLMPEGHPLRSGSLNNLAAALLKQFQQQCEDGIIIQEALQHAHAAAEQALSPSHQLSAQFHLADIHLVLWQTKHIKQHLEDAMHHYKVAAQFTLASPLERLKSSLTWIRAAEEHLHPSALDAYTQSLHLLDSHVSATTTMSSHHQNRAGHYTGLNLHAFELHLMSSNLVMQGQQSAVEAKVQHYRNLLWKWNRVVEEIRTLDGFSQFLLPPLFRDLQEASCKGPVIVLIASKFSCDAIIVLHQQSPIHIQLQTTWEEMSNLVEKHLQEHPKFIWA
ncbi:hypothetical protein BU15DRAFT_65358 [Melanogaster broomeanus]|nr:hypothetical protein BU15DRAFT_65358 [Melanogaster broomeanus]